MRALALVCALSVLVFAKDNYIFDYSSEALIGERIERLESEVAALKGELIALSANQIELAKSDKGFSGVKKLEEAIVKLTKENAALAAAQKKIAASIPKSAAGSVQTIVERPSAETDERLDKLEEAIAALQKAPAPTIAPSAGGKTDDATALRINTLADRVFALETKLKETQARIDDSAGLPFDQYLTITKAHIEYFVLGLLAFIVLLFLLLLIALGRASRADSRIAQLVKLYQSSSRKSEDRK
ncbi:MAG: hypothetical protein LBC09_07285 [Helicobacteraceae bacterium]|nr:hypothetical protein [Helicobacteraceae bacterium]